MATAWRLPVTSLPCLLPLCRLPCLYSRITVAVLAVAHDDDVFGMFDAALQVIVSRKRSHGNLYFHERNNDFKPAVD